MNPPTLKKLRDQKDAATSRANKADFQLIKASKILEKARKALYDYRHTTFQRVVAVASETDIIPEVCPPGYQTESLPTLQDESLPAYQSSTG